MLFECVGGKKQVKPTKKVGIKMGRRYPSAPAIVHMITGLCCKTFLGERDLDICANPSAVLCQFATCNTVLDTRTDVRADACERVGEKIFHAHFSWQEKKSTFSHKTYQCFAQKISKGAPDWDKETQQHQSRSYEYRHVLRKRRLEICDVPSAVLCHLET